MSNNKQSSVVDWIFSQLPDEYTTTRSGFDVYQQAKAMHNEEMKEMYLKGIENYDPTFKRKDNETYGGSNEQQ